MGDLIHALPALTDAKKAFPNISFDWVVEKNFSEIPAWHPAVKNIIPTSHRKWKKNIFQSLQNGDIKNFITTLRNEKYDLIIDGQSSIKSAVVTGLAKGIRVGLAKDSVREWGAHLFYQRKINIAKDIHAIKRLRLLFAKALNYPFVDNDPDYGLTNYPFADLKFALPKNYLVFVHNASWNTKLWLESYWQHLIKFADEANLEVLLSWGNAQEKERAIRLAEGQKNAHVLPFCSLAEQAKILQGAKAALCCDTGLAHLAAALNAPAITLYGSTDPKLIGTIGLHQQHAVSPFPCVKCYQHQCNYEDKSHPEAVCMAAIKPEMIWEDLRKILTSL